MGQCLASEPERDATDGYTPGRGTYIVGGNIDLQYAGDRQLETAPAGRVGPADAYVLANYNETLENINDWAIVINTDYNEIINTFEKKKTTNNQEMRFYLSCDRLAEFYKAFFHHSAYRVDKHVQLRKDIAVEGKQKLTAFRNAIYNELRKAKPNFKKCERLSNSLCKSVDDLYSHFYKTHPCPPRIRRESVVSVARKAKRLQASSQAV